MLKLQPMSRERLDDRCQGELTEIQSLEPDSSLKGKNKYRDSKIESHVRYCIHLQNDVPVINPLTCGQQYLKASKVLGLSKAELEELVDFRVAWDKRIGHLRSVEECEEPVYNGAALQLYIREMDIEDDIDSIMNGLVGKAIPKGYTGYATREKKGYKFYANYRVVVESIDGEEVPPDVYRKLDKARERYIASGKFGRANLLINIMNAHKWDGDLAKQYLESMFIVKSVVVIPYTLRPTSDRQKHPMTQVYSRLFQANTEVYMYRNGRPDDFKEHYRKIVYLVQSIMTENAFAKSDLSSLDPLLKRIKGKNGIIRSTLLKKRQDYSGRSVVIVDPFIPVNCIGIPKTMIIKLFRKFLTSTCGIQPQVVVEKLNDPEFIDKAVESLRKNGVFDDVPILLGRNPTLHKHGIQGFYVKPVGGRAIKVNPLVCPAFNMDFDGDAAHDEVPITPMAQYEVAKLIMSDKNIILPKTGKCTICPEKDVIYGLYVCTCKYANGKSGGSYPDATTLKEALYSQKCNVWDTVSVGGLGSGQAGRLAFESCFPAKVAKSIEDKPVDQSYMKDIIAMIQGFSTESFDRCVNSLVELGMRIAYLYGKSVSVLEKMNPVEAFDSAIDNFNAEMEEVYELSDLGFYDTDSFEYDLSNRLDKAMKIMNDNIYDRIPDNMFKAMAVSGARGSASNLVQMFGCKGRIQKSEAEAFNILIEHSMRDQLTPMDQSISGHGARRGQISKSIKTADTGYLSRKLNHAAGSLIITEEDCGTREGVTVNFLDIQSRYVTETMTDADIFGTYSKAESTMVQFIVGRYKTANNMKITETEAWQIARSRGSVKIRSPLTCDNPCCQKCYGTYCETGDLPAVGFPAGFIAATSMAEPSTQLVMKVFQLGGVVGAASPFDRLNALLCGQNIRQRASQGIYPSYDPIAWAPGILRVKNYNNILNMLIIEPPEDPSPEYDYKINRLAPRTAKYKDGEKVVPGETLRIEHGDSYIPEKLKYAGLEAAWMEMLYSLYFLFKSQVDLLPIHFEVMISMCTGYMPVISDSPKVRFGKYYTKRLLIDTGITLDLDSGAFIPKICGVDEIVLDSPNFMEAFIFEDQREALSEAVVNCLSDVVNSPLVQLALGHRVKVGTGYSDTFLEDMA